MNKLIIPIYITLVVAFLVFQIISTPFVSRYSSSFSEPGNQYGCLLNINSSDSLHLGTCFIPKGKNLMSLYLTKNSDLLIYKLPLRLTRGIFDQLKIEEGYESTDNLNDKGCIRADRPYFDYNLCLDSFNTQSNVIFKIDGDSLNVRKANDSTISCNILLRSFNLKYTDTGETDLQIIKMRAKKNIKFNFCLLSRNKNVYFISMCSNLPDYNIDDDEIIRLLK